MTDDLTALYKHMPFEQLKSEQAELEICYSRNAGTPSGRFAAADASVRLHAIKPIMDGHLDREQAKARRRAMFDGDMLEPLLNTLLFASLIWMALAASQQADDRQSKQTQAIIKAVKEGK